MMVIAFVLGNMQNSGLITNSQFRRFMTVNYAKNVELISEFNRVFNMQTLHMDMKRTLAPRRLAVFV